MNIGEETQTPLTLCWHCDRALDAATPVDDDDAMRPEPGAISLCLYCGAVAVFGDDLRLEPPTEKLLNELEGNQEFRQRYVHFSWARQYVMQRESLLRDRTDPDR